jgi:diguanylate cyclase (GGDEF)-like protein/PAS domain S-box-containing protein
MAKHLDIHPSQARANPQEIPADSSPSASFYHDLVDGLDVPVYFVDPRRVITFWNKAAEEVTGFPAAEVVGRHCSANILDHVDAAGRALCKDGCPLLSVLETGTPTASDVFLRHKDGHRIPVDVRATPIRSQEGRVIGVAEVFANRSHKLEQEARLRDLERLALLDGLTELPNRRQFDHQLNNRIQEFERYGWTFGLLMIDIDKFKTFNDTHGHQTGDAGLRLVAKTLSNNMRIYDTVARWGGEEFAVIVANVGKEALLGVAEKLRALVQKSRLCMPSGESLAVTISVGCGLVKQGDTCDMIQQRADACLYRAKETGRNRVCID